VGFGLYPVQTQIFLKKGTFPGKIEGVVRIYDRFNTHGAILQIANMVGLVVVPLCIILLIFSGV
jgi:hypothetical protein